MSDESNLTNPTPNEAGTEAKDSTAAKAKKPRSPVERTVVWGVIGVLLIVAAIQGVAVYGFSRSRDDIKTALNRVNAATEGELFGVDDAEKLMTGFWTKSEIKKAGRYRYVVYKWPGVYTSYRLLLNVGMGATNPAVISYQTNTDVSRHEEILDEVYEPPKVAATDETGSTSDASANGTAETPANGQSPQQGESGGRGAEGERGRAPIDWAALDADGDGKISKEEAPESVQPFFDRIDTNGDGFIDEAEREASQRRREAREAAGEGGDGDSSRNRPRRPDESDGSTEPDSQSPAPNSESTNASPPDRPKTPASQP